MLIYAGIDPIIGKEVRLVEITSDPNEADRILDRMRVELAKRKRARTKAILNQAIDDWLRFPDVEETMLQTYIGYIERTIRPALGEEPVERIGAKELGSSTRIYAVAVNVPQRQAGGGPPDCYAPRVPGSGPSAAPRTPARGRGTRLRGCGLRRG